MNPLLLPWIAEVVLITYRSAAKGEENKTPIPHLPLPSEYVASFIVFGVLAFAPGQLTKPAAVFGWGVVVATFLNLWDPSTGGITFKKPTVSPSNQTGA